jgi:cell wall-associated NlpC family hydrolase
VPDFTRRGRRHRPAGRDRRIAAALLAAGLALPIATSPAARATPSLVDARAQAAQLRATVDRLEVSAEQASEAYDAAQERLGAAVQDYLSAEERLGAAQERSRSTVDASAARVRALYESGGAIGLYASVLDGASITDVLDRVQLARNVIAQSQSSVTAAGADVATLARLHAELGRLAATRARLQAAAADQATRVRALLASREQLLATADERVRELVAAEQAARAAAAARAFVARLQAAQAQAAAAGLPVGPISAPTPQAAAAIAAARTRRGAPYVWGAVGPGTFDCSGLTGWAYAQAGVRLPRTAAEQWYAGPHPALADLAPGDLLFWATDPANPATIHHVALYIGGGEMIAAPHTGAVVRVQRVYLDGFVGAVRPVPGNSGTSSPTG